MIKTVTQFAFLSFFLLTLINAEAGWVRFSGDAIKLTIDSPQPSDLESPYPDDLPSDAEEDTTETREFDQHTSHFIFAYSADPLLNLHYIHQHLVYKEHHIELIVPPPKA